MRGWKLQGNGALSGAPQDMAVREAPLARDLGGTQLAEMAEQSSEKHWTQLRKVARKLVQVLELQVGKWRDEVEIPEAFLRLTQRPVLPSQSTRALT